MIATIFSAIETRLIAHASFSGFTFFRFDSEANASQQSRGSIPFLRLVWESDNTRREPQRWKLNNTLLLSLEVRWKSSYTDVNAVERITEQENYRTAILQSLFPQSGEEDFLNLSKVANLRLEVRPLELGGLETKKHNGIISEITIEYYQGI